MTDNEIIKALECCIKGSCDECPAYAMNCGAKVPMAFALALINHQKGEIERLEDLVYLADSETANVRDLYFEEKSERAEAIKEFAEKLKARVVDDFMNYKTDATIGYIDNLVKEMVGEEK